MSKPAADRHESQGRSNAEHGGFKFGCLVRATELFHHPLGLPQVAALVCGIDEEAGPDAIANARVDRRCEFDLVDGAAPAEVQSRNDALLPIEEAGEHDGNFFAVDGLKWKQSFRSDSCRRFENPGKQAAPEVGDVGSVQLCLARACIGDDLLPDGEIGVGAEAEVLEALGDCPGTRSRGFCAQSYAGRLDQSLGLGAQGGELSFKLIEGFGPFDSERPGAVDCGGFDFLRYTRISYWIVGLRHKR